MVSIIIPCRNEEKYIAKCLDSVVSQDYAKENLEVLIVDGMSGDKTREIVKRYSEKYPFVKLLNNAKKFTCFAFNIGLKASRGKIIIIMGAHAGYEKDYVSKCVRYLKEYNADNVGGVIKTRPSKNTLFAKTIALVLSHPFGAGGATFRTLSRKINEGEESKLSSSPFAAAREVDTVFGGCYKREVFDKVGLFNEKLLRSQDFEFNKRLRKADGKILLVPEITVYYYPSSTFIAFLKHNFNDGFWVTYPLKFGIKIFALRHLLPLFFVSGLIVLLFLSFFSNAFSSLFFLAIFLYVFVAGFFSLKIALKEKDFKLIIILPLIFANRHFGYGIGSILGLLEKWKKEKK